MQMILFKNIITPINEEGGRYMRTIAIIAVVIAVAISAMPAFAGGAGCASKSSEKSCEKSLFQIVSDEIGKAKVRDQDKLIAVPPEQVNVFQSVSDGIKEGSAKAKQGSLR